MVTKSKSLLLHNVGLFLNLFVSLILIEFFKCFWVFNGLLSVCFEPVCHKVCYFQVFSQLQAFALL